MTRLYAHTVFVAFLAVLTAEAARSEPAPWNDAKDRWLRGVVQSDADVAIGRVEP